MEPIINSIIARLSDYPNQTEPNKTHGLLLCLENCGIRNYIMLTQDVVVSVQLINQLKAQVLFCWVACLYIFKKGPIFISFFNFLIKLLTTIIQAPLCFFSTILYQDQLLSLSQLPKSSPFSTISEPCLRIIWNKIFLHHRSTFWCKNFSSSFLLTSLLTSCFHG